MSTATNTTKAPKAAAAKASAKAGFKQTKLGWIPEVWMVAELSELAGREGMFIDGDWIESKDMSASGIALVQTGNIGIGQLIGISDKYISEGTFHELKCTELRSGDILICRMADPAGRACKLEVPSGMRLITSVDVSIMRTDASLVADEYLLQWLSSPWYLRDVAKSCTGSAHKRISRSNLGKMLVALPPLTEQRRIAAVLGAWDRAIATVQQLLAAQQERKRGLMNTVLSNIYHHRHKASIGDIAVEVSERNPDGTDHIVLSCSKHKGFVSSLEYFKKQVFSEDRSNYKIIRRGQFGFPANHIEEGSIDLLREHEAGLLSPIYVVFEFNHATVNSEFMYYLFKSERYKHIFRTSTNASVDRRGSLRWNDFKNLWVPLPERDEQDRLAKLFTGLDKQIEQTQNYLDHLTTQKRGLMQQLLTGAVRVRV